MRWSDLTDPSQPSISHPTARATRSSSPGPISTCPGPNSPIESEPSIFDPTARVTPAGRYPGSIPGTPRVPRAPTGRVTPGAFRVRHASRELQLGESPREQSELATCPECPSRENPSGCRPSWPHVLEAHTESHPPDTFRVR